MSSSRMIIKKMKMLLTIQVTVLIFLMFETEVKAQKCENGKTAQLENNDICENSNKGSCCHGRKCVKGDYVEVNNLFGCEFMGRCYKNDDVLQREKPGSAGVCYKHICKAGAVYYYPHYQYEGCWVKVKGKYKCKEPGRAWTEDCIKYRCIAKNGKYYVRQVHSKSKCKGVNGCIVPNSPENFDIENGDGGLIKNCLCSCTTKRNKKCREAPSVGCVGVPATMVTP